MKTIDACGKSCPEPLIILKTALKTEKNLTLLVDSKNAMENCVEYAKKNNHKVDVKKEEDIYYINLT